MWRAQIHVLNSSYGLDWELVKDKRPRDKILTVRIKIDVKDISRTWGLAKCRTWSPVRESELKVCIVLTWSVAPLTEIGIKAGAS